LVEAVSWRIGLASIGIASKTRIAATRARPVVAMQDGQLVFAGDSEMLIAVAEARDDKGLWAAAAIDALAAHCMTLVNQERGQVHDSHERAALEMWLQSP
jgi:hypothetical protein